MSIPWNILPTTYHARNMQSGVDYPGLGVGAFIVNDKGEILLGLRGPEARNEPGHWNIPGGGVEFGERRADAVVREVLEEVGVAVEVVAELITTDHHIPATADRPYQHWVTTPFVVQLLPGQKPKAMEPTKFAQLTWFSIDNLPQPLVVSMRPNLQAYREYVASARPKD